MKNARMKLVLLLAVVALISITTVSVAFAAWYSGKTITDNTITTGESVTYTMNSSMTGGTGLMPGGIVTQTLTIDLDGDAAATLTVSALAAKKTVGETPVAGIGTYLTYKLYQSDGTTEVTENITANGTYKLIFTLDGSTPVDFANCTITYTLTLASTTLS